MAGSEEVGRAEGSLEATTLDTTASGMVLAEQVEGEAAQQGEIVGARQFVHAPETCQRLPEVARLAGAILSYAAATAPALPTGFWDRHPQPTPGQLRRALARCPFPQDFTLPARIRAKAARTDHLPTGFWGQRRRRTPAPDETTGVLCLPPLPQVA